jgi:predicted  nucleic acid-binding Zn-ribbon protein
MSLQKEIHVLHEAMEELNEMIDRLLYIKKHKEDELLELKESANDMP